MNEIEKAIQTLDNLASVQNGYGHVVEACDLAIAALRKELEANEPLTLEELRQMVGQPVWTVGVSFHSDGSDAMWDIIESVDDDGIEFGYSTESMEWWNYNLRNSDGTLCGCAWLAFRRKPEIGGADHA